MSIEHREVKGERFYNDIEARYSTKELQKLHIQPKRSKYNSMWKKVKRTMIKRLLPTIRELADVDLRADYDDGVISASVRVYFAGELMFSRSKKFKV